MKLSHEDIAEIEVLTDVAMATMFWLSLYRVHIGATWRIRPNRRCAAPMRPCVKLLSPLVIFADRPQLANCSCKESFTVAVQIRLLHVGNNITSQNAERIINLRTGITDVRQYG